MADCFVADTCVAMCDWNGRLVWTSHPNPCCSVGTPVWENVPAEHLETVKSAVSRAVATQESQQYEVANAAGEHYRVWMWPLNSPDMAVCMLATRVPAELSLLTTRERECLGWLASGYSAGTIAHRLDVSISTVHTHLKRAREKLRLQGAESLIGFAAKYCNSNGVMVRDQSESNAAEIDRKRAPSRRRR